MVNKILIDIYIVIYLVAISLFVNINSSIFYEYEHIMKKLQTNIVYNGKEIFAARSETAVKFPFAARTTSIN